MKACEALITHAGATGINIPAGADLFAVWKVHCRDMPACLLATGLPDVLKHWTNTFSLPSPGAVWEAIKPQVRRAQADLAILENAMRQLPDTDDPDADDRAPTPETQRIVDQTVAHLKSVTGSQRRIA